MKHTFGLLLGLVMLSGCVQTTPSPGLPSPNPPTVTASFTPTPVHTGTPTPSPTATPQCQSPEGSMVQTSYVGAVIREPINVRIFLPPCYENTESSYPTLYLLHGWPYDESHWDELGADELALAAMQDGTWPPFILVMPYAPTILFTGTDGGSWSYEGEFLQGLVPWIDSNYRTITHPYWRGFVGISRGGIWSLEVALLHPDVIDSVAALSPAFALNLGRPMYDPFRLILRGEPRPDRIFLMAGDTDWARQDTERFSQALDSLGIPHELVISPGKHQDETWRQVVPEVLAFFADAWQEGGAILTGSQGPNPPEN